MTFEYEKDWTPVSYRGVRYRSVLEAQWAYMFGHFDIRAKYEPEQFQTDRGPYTPDFLLEEIGYVEIKPLKPKGAQPCSDEYESAELKLSALARVKRARFYILLCGSPLHHTSWCLDSEDYSHAFHDNEFFTHDHMVWWGRRGEPAKATWVGANGRGGRWKDIAERAAAERFTSLKPPSLRPPEAQRRIGPSWRDKLSWLKR